MKKVCFLTPAVLGNDGFSTHITEVWKRMPKKLNAEVHFIIIKGNNDKRISNVKNLKIIELPPFQPKERIEKFFIKGLLYQLYVFLYCLKLKDLKLIYSRYTTINFADILISKFKQIPLVVEVNAFYRLQREKTIINKIKIVINEFLGKVLFKNAATIIAVTDSLKQILHNKFGIPNNKIFVVPNGVDEKLFRPMDSNLYREKLKIDKLSKIVCYAGNLAFWQGVEYLINSIPLVLKKVPNAIFLIVGSGPLEEEIKSDVKKLGLNDKIIFTGRVPYQEVPIYINSSDICITLKKRLAQGFSPLKLYEYLACGKPVIATNTYGLDIIKNQNLGILVDSEDPKKVSSAIVKLLKNDDLRNKMGRNGRKIVLENFTWEINSKKVGSLCKKYI